MAEQYKPIETKQDRQQQAVKQVWEGVKAVVGFLATAVGQALDRAIPMGASEIANQLYSGNALVQNHFDDSPGQSVGAPQQEAAEQTQSTGIEPPKRHQAESASQSELLNGYLTGYKPPVRVDHNTMYHNPNTQSHSL